MIKSNLKPILDQRKISIRKLSRDIDHEYPTVKKLYNDEMERYPRELTSSCRNCRYSKKVIIISIAQDENGILKLEG